MFIRFLRDHYLNANKMFEQGEVVDVDQQIGTRFILDGIAINVLDDLHAVGRSPIVLAQCAIPMVLQSSGTMGNNGALSGITALPQAYSSCYMYFPANAIAAGSAAGLYYTVMSSTTAGQVFANQYTFGIPQIPANPTPIIATGPGAYVQTTAAAITVFSMTVPGGLLGPNGVVRSMHAWSAANTVTTKNITAIFAGLPSGTTGNISNNLGARGISEWRNQGSVNRQSYAQSAGVNFIGNNYTFGASDTSVAQNFSYTSNLIGGTATDFLVLEGFDIVVQPGA